ncbi:thioredoxin family protein [Cocleimonas sp. KMM 6892]|uniref:thioredoxin family protein n=1 Tax=unclassified Cocleimonas TaxID=2639732 RepID=UPI002DB86A0F|nr:MULTISPECIES: thioredoxin family protein [unclassified Cocleimonas]MEB8430769.1 thioredoxin family protein [Cocleimonas sp. KMM 6892]MEC4714459.1 thioredoxin family protein [Cocleimonas sp. KMM 6895]MEC4743792.1 thioredoxin family protein [Cocleimonas sp. KMM 6896]
MNSLKTLIALVFITILQISTFADDTAHTNQTEIRDYSTFFDESLGDMQEEKEIATEEGKKGILLMFEMDECPFCARMKKTVLNRGKVQDYYRKHFRIITVDIEGDLELTDFAGKDTTQKVFSLEQFRVRATPVFQFLDLEGKPIKNGRLTGASKDADEFMMLGKYIVEGANEEMPFIRYKRKQKKG